MKKRILAICTAVGTLVVLTATNVYAADSNPASSGLVAPTGLKGPTTLAGLITIVTNLLLGIAGAVAVIFIIIGGIQYTTSGGSEDKTRTAKSTITNAVIGLIITILAFVIVNFVISIFK